MLQRKCSRVGVVHNRWALNFSNAIATSASVNYGEHILFAYASFACANRIVSRGKIET
jgi:hypothetical protein